MVDELCHVFELVQQQPEEMQRYIAALIAHELAENEIEVPAELAAELAIAQAEIVGGDVRDYETYRHERSEREQHQCRIVYLQLNK